MKGQSKMEMDRKIYESLYGQNPNLLKTLLNNALINPPKKSKFETIIKKVKGIFVYLFEADIAKLNALKEKLKCSKSEIIRRALNMYYISEMK